jgi:hypothetical protein
MVAPTAPQPALHAGPALAAGSARTKGLLKDLSQVQGEARSKIFWGDAPQDVVRFITMHGITYEEASGLVAALVQERASMLRGIGFRKIVVGSAMMCVPFIAWFLFRIIRYLPLKILGAAIVVGLWGAYMVLKGVFMLMAPKSEPGDVADA